MLKFYRNRLMASSFATAALIMIGGYVNGVVHGEPWASNIVMVLWFVFIALPSTIAVWTFALGKEPVIFSLQDQLVFRHKLYPFVKRQSCFVVNEIVRVSTSIIDERQELLVVEITENEAVRLLSEKHVFVSLGENRFGYECGSLFESALTISELAQLKVCSNRDRFSSE